ncbi:MAG: hypothetical protein M3M96_08660 [Candidatus Eremiobacteraeota bacterium]|nr:hypothetical protein [Candidatus Eremiobacteraeota bacterium]
MHEIFASFFPVIGHYEEKPEVISILHIARIVHRPKPTPKPRPQVHRIAPKAVKPTIVNPAAMSQNQHVARHAQKRAIARTRYHSKPALVHVATGGQGASTSSGRATTGGVGTGGTGSGTGGSGNGTGGALPASEPCGFVEFVDINGISNYDRATGGFFVNVRMTVHFPDHTAESVDLDYPWYYPSEAKNPWSDQNLKNPDFPVTLQAPPAGKIGSEPDLVKYVVRHSSRDGFTKLRDCPT